jgi:hypothetical protein
LWDDVAVDGWELDYESKRDRDRMLIDRLRRHGLERAERCLRDPDDHLLSVSDPATG